MCFGNIEFVFFWIKQDERERERESGAAFSRFSSTHTRARERERERQREALVRLFQLFFLKISSKSRAPEKVPFPGSFSFFVFSCFFLLLLDYF